MHNTNGRKWRISDHSPTPRKSGFGSIPAIKPVPAREQNTAFCLLELCTTLGRFLIGPREISMFASAASRIYPLPKSLPLAGRSPRRSIAQRCEAGWVGKCPYAPIENLRRSPASRCCCRKTRDMHPATDLMAFSGTHNQSAAPWYPHL